MPEILLRSRDARFGLHLGAGHVERILELCADAGDDETGGVLLGRYNTRRDTALVTGVLGPPRDSGRGRTWFHRGVDGVQRIIYRAWDLRREYYLGEWHFHPFAAPEPSPKDFRQMGEIADSASWKCPEPILLIIGGDPLTNWWPYGLVTTRTGSRIPLAPA